jgi:hypothetical protein
MSADRGRSRTMPQERPFHAAPLLPVEEEGDENEQRKESKTRRFFRAIGFGCFMSKGKHAKDGSGKGAALRAININDSQHPYNQNTDADETSSVVSSYYAGRNAHSNQYMLYLGTEKTSNYKPSFVLPAKPGDLQVSDLSELRPSMNERQLPVFFTPPPPDAFTTVTPRRRSALNFVSPPGSPKGIFA